MSKTRQWTALGAAAVLSVLSLGWFLVISPMRGEAAELVAATEAQQLHTAALTSQLQVLRAQAAELPAQQARLAELQQELPETVALPDLIRLLTAAADEAGVELTSISPSAPVANGTLAEVPLALTVDGTYFNLQQFLGALEDLPRAFLIAGFSLAPQGDDSTELQLSLNGKVFTQQLPNGPAAATVPPAGTTASATTGHGTATPDAATGAEPVPSTASTS